MSNVFDRIVLAGGIESTFRAGGTPNLLTDTFDVGDLVPTPNIARLERSVQRANFSPVQSRAGRKFQSFSFMHEVNGPGAVTGLVAPAWGRLMRMCGFSQTAFTTAGTALMRAHPANGRTGVAMSAVATAYTGTLPRLVTVTATSGTQVRIDAPALPNGAAVVSAAPATVTSATPLATAVQGATMTLTFTGSLVTGDRYMFWFVPPGFLYSPVSDPLTGESGFLHGYFGNKRHVMNGVRGTFSLAATAGELAKFAFTMNGDWAVPDDQTFPSSFSYGNFPVPPMVELANVSVDATTVTAPTTFGFDIANSVTNRLSANALGANEGAMLTGRVPVATFNMDAVPASVMNAFDFLDKATVLQLSAYMGVVPGNCVTFLANGQLNNSQYGDLESIRKNDNTMPLTGISGNDELLIYAC